MADLEDTFGEEFAKNLNRQIAKRRERRNKVDDEMKNLIAHKAINEEQFHGGEPHFTVKDDEGIKHDVLLMDVPNPRSKSFFSMVRELESGAVTAPLNYLGEFMSTLWNDPDMLRELNEGENYVVVGELDQWESDDGEVHDQLQPVRGVMGLEELKQRAQRYLDQQADDMNTGEDEDSPEVVQQTSPDSDIQEPDEDRPDPEPPEPETEPPEPEPEPEASEPEPEEPVEEEQEEEQKKPRFKASKKEEPEEEEPELEPEPDTDDEDSVLDELSSEGDQEEEDDEDTPRGISNDQVAAHIETLAQKEPAVWDVEEGDPRLDKLAQVVTKRLDLDPEDPAVVQEVKTLCLKRIEEERVSQSEDDEDEDEEDSLF